MTKEQPTIEKIGEAGGVWAGGSGKKRVLWLHTQPEHYHNCMLDDLARGTGYRVAGMAEPRSEEFEYIAAFGYAPPPGESTYAQNRPEVVQTIFLRPEQGREQVAPTFYGRYHENWWRDLRGLGFDAMIVSGYGQLTAREVIAECDLRNVPVAVWSDSNLRSDRGRGIKMRAKRMLKRWRLRKLTRGVDYLMTANRLGEAYWRYYGGQVARPKIVISPCYSNYRRIDAAKSEPRDQVLRKIGLAAGDRYVFSPARLVAAKGLDLAIRAFLAGGFAARGWKYVLAGTGPLQAELGALAGAELGKSILLVGFQQPEVNLALMAHAEMMVLPSRFEPHGIVVGEALAAGTPVLLSDIVGAAAGVVKNGVNGVMFRSEDVEDLGRKLKVLEDAGAMAQLRGAARPSFEAWYREYSPMVVVPRVVRAMLANVGGVGGGGRE